MNGICPNCEKVTSIERINNFEDINIRGEVITIKNDYFLCKECGQEFVNTKINIDPLEEAYKKYRELKGMVTPEEIRDYRKEFNLTQEEFSKLLGIGIATINRYENGALQSEAHDRILSLYMDPRNFKNLIQKDTEVLGLEKRKEILMRIKREKDYYLKIAEDISNRSEPNVNNGNRVFDFEKFHNAIKFFCFRGKVFKTKLTKLIFFADFEHFRQYSISITGARYAHLPYGPVPDNYETLLGLVLENDSNVKLEEYWDDDYSGELFISDAEPNYSIFSNSEIKVLSTIKEKFAVYSTSGIREFSHNEVGYQKTNNGEIISYSFAKELQEI
jgi:putative zinc finger/helix-turn-helix YgiT family protein